MNIIYFLHTQLSSSQFFNKLSRALILTFEIPVIERLFILNKAIIASTRGSIADAERFNLLMSDLDFSIVADERDHNHILAYAAKLKKLFLNLGELEIYTQAEWERLTELQDSEYHKIWHKLNLIRKCHWQSIKLLNATSEYEQAKHSRGLNQTLSRLNSTSLLLKGEEIFDFILSHDSPCCFSFPSYSPFLESEITNQADALSGIYFSQSHLAWHFNSILPENDTVPVAKDMMRIKLYLLEREYLISKASLRLQIFNNPNSDMTSYRIWHQDLQRRISLIRKQISEFRN